ncbi:MAG: cell division protein FtsQ/DivIB [Gammaproteobacteria bacterium]|nr:cell division protein FtsQ/DivIB [Gammaproteobacteria bacterium]
MSAIGRFLAGLLIGIALPLSVALLWTKVSGIDPIVVVHGDMTQEQEAIISSRVEDLIDELGVGLSPNHVESEVGRISWVEEADVWRTLTNRLHIEISSKTVEIATKNSKESQMDPAIAHEKADINTDLELDASTIVRIGDRVREQGDVLENAIRTSEGLKIVLESGTSVLLGNRDLHERLDRFLAVYRELEAETDLSRVVADARYDQGVAVVVMGEGDDSTFDNDGEIASGPLVITHE